MITMDDIREACPIFFEPATMQFFDSEIDETIYEGPGGVYFVTSEQFHGSNGSLPRTYNVRGFSPASGHIWTVKSDFKSWVDAQQAANKMANTEEKES